MPMAGAVAGARVRRDMRRVQACELCGERVPYRRGRDAPYGGDVFRRAREEDIRAADDGAAFARLCGRCLWLVPEEAARLGWPLADRGASEMRKSHDLP